MPLPPGFGPRSGAGSGSGSGSGAGCGLELNQPVSFDMLQFARQESLLAMAVNLPLTASAAAPSSLQRRRMPAPDGIPEPSPSPSSLRLPGAATLISYSDAASTGVYSIASPVGGQTRLPSFAAVTAAAAADSSPASSSPSSPSAASSSSHPVLPPLPSNLPQASSPSYLPWTSQQHHHHFQGLDPLVSLSAPLTTNSILGSSISSISTSTSTGTSTSGTDDSSDTPAHFSTPSFNHFPAQHQPQPQPLPYWPSYDSSFNRHARWNESAVPVLPSSSPSSPPSPRPSSDEASLLQDLDIHSDIDIDADFRAENLRARHRALAATLATFSAASASSSSSTAPRQRHHHNHHNHHHNHRAIHNQASPQHGFAASRTVTGAFTGILHEPDDFPFPFPLAHYPPLSSFSSSNTMPSASTARRRSQRQAIITSEPVDNSTSTSTSPSTGTETAPVIKRQRVVPSGAHASRQVIDDDDDDDDSSLFGDSKPVLVEEYTTIDLTEATQVPEELKKPKVDKRTKLSGFQCVICMDDVTGLTLTHCGHLFCAQCLHSSLNIDSTRGKCPMCRTKIDMKPRENYTIKTKGYWPLELKLMTRTRQGKRKAQAMAQN